MAAPKGIYQIKSNKNGRIYIGSSYDIKRRWRLHKSELINNKHHSIILQRHFNKYGLNDLEFSILEKCHVDDLIIREQYYLTNLNPYFNIRKIADSNKGIKRSEETKEKLRIINTGKKLKDSTKAKMSKRMIGNNYSKNRIPVNARKVIDLDTNKIYDSSTIAAKDLGYNPRTLRAWLDGQNKNNTKLRYYVRST